MKFKWLEIKSDILTLSVSVEQLKKLAEELFEIAQEQNKYLDFDALDREFGTSYNKLRVDNKFDEFIFRNKHIID